MIDEDSVAVGVACFVWSGVLDGVILVGTGTDVCLSLLAQAVTKKTAIIVNARMGKGVCAFMNSPLNAKIREMEKRYAMRRVRHRD